MRVMLTGTYSSANKGDAAMELAMIGALRREAPDVDVVVSSPFPDLDRPVYAPTTVVGCHRRDLLGFVQVLVALLGRLLGRPRWLLRGTELEALADTDLVVDLSGDMLTEDYGVLVAVSHYLPLLQARALGVPYVICAQSVGPFRWTRPLAHWLIRGASAVTVRESITAERLARVRPDLERTADMAMLLEPDEGRLPPGLASGDTGTPVLGVSLSSLVANTHEGGPEAFVDAVVRGLERVLAAHPHRVLLVAHVTGPSIAKDDRVIAREVAALLGDRAEVADVDLHPAGIKALIADSDVFLGARMHANIAALTSGVPVVAIGYSHKTRGIMREFGQDDLVVDAARLEPGVLSDRLLTAIRERGERAATLRSRRDPLRQAAHRNVRLVLELLGRDRP